MIKIEITAENAIDLKNNLVSLIALLTTDIKVAEGVAAPEKAEEPAKPKRKRAENTHKAKVLDRVEEIKKAPKSIMDFSNLDLGLPTATPPSFANTAETADTVDTIDTMDIADTANIAETAAMAASSPTHLDIMRLLESFNMADNSQMDRMQAIFGLYNTNKSLVDDRGLAVLDTSNITPENAAKFINRVNALRNWVVTGQQ